MCCPIHCLFFFLRYSWQRRCQRIVVEDKLACEWLSERGRHFERPGPARTGLVRIRSGFLSGFRSDSHPLDSDQNLNRIALVCLNSNQSKDRLLAAGWYVPCPVYGLLCVYVACQCSQVSIHHTNTTWAFSERCINVCHRWTYGTSRANAERNNYSIQLISDMQV